MGFISILLFLVSALVPLIVIGAIISFFVRGFSNRNSNTSFTKDDGEDMLKNIYTYLVLFATLMMAIGGSVGIFMGVADYIVPEPYVESYETYRSNYGRDNYNTGVEIIIPKQVEESDIRESYDQMVKDEDVKAQRSALKLIIQSIGWIAIPLPIFLYYQKQIKTKKDVEPAL